MRFFMAVIIGLWIAGCGDATNAPAAGDIAGLTSDANQSQMYATQQIQMVATASYTQGVPDRNVTEYVTWDSNDTSIADVTTDGVVYGSSAGGDVNITASFESFYSVNTITVIGLNAISIDANETNLTVEQTVQITATGTFEDNATLDITESVTWVMTVPDDSNATLESNGTLYTGDVNGTIELNATRGDVNASASFSISL